MKETFELHRLPNGKYAGVVTKHSTEDEAKQPVKYLLPVTAKQLQGARQARAMIAEISKPKTPLEIEMYNRRRQYK